ncbi:hypothetical protein [Devosia marina]|uniref:Uncharacterized protein n=1 Tax=Devosia marina TaxID=2683198 RepID=A0A7X3K362_9HYPH|nr:hypothetical protein [Devosia marina]MVS98269.1 hypothetical protein [Devosia marina]
MPKNSELASAPLASENGRRLRRWRLAVIIVLATVCWILVLGAIYLVWLFIS